MARHFFGFPAVQELLIQEPASISGQLRLAGPAQTIEIGLPKGAVRMLPLAG